MNNLLKQNKNMRRVKIIKMFLGNTPSLKRTIGGRKEIEQIFDVDDVNEINRFNKLSVTNFKHKHLAETFHSLRSARSVFE